MNTNRRSPWRKLAGFTFALIVPFLFQHSYTQAQTQEAPKETPEVQQQLKERLQKLEPTVLDLKGQINAIEETKKKSPTPAIVEATYSEPAPLAAPATPASGNLLFYPVDNVMVGGEGASGRQHKIGEMI